MKNIAIDIGGTNMRLGLVDGLELSDNIKISTPQDYDEGLDLLALQIARLKDGGELGSICVGIPGTLTSLNRIIVRTPNLPDWSKRSFADDLEQRTGVKTYLHNDTELLALGEANQKQFEDLDVIGYLAIGTGVGGARIVNRRLDSNRFGFEPGHQIIDYERNISLESVVGGRSIMNQAGKVPSEIDDPAFWTEKHRVLAAGVYNLILLWSPAALIFGGGMFDEETYKIELLRSELEKLNQMLPELPALHRGVLGDQAGLIGAAHFMYNLR